MQLTSAQKLIAAIVVVVVLAALAVFLLIVPQFSAMSRLDEQIAQAEADIEAARTLLGQRQQIKQRSAETEAQLIKMTNEMPETPEFPAFIIELQDTVNESGLDFASLTPGMVGDPVDGYRTIDMGIMVAGRWQDVVDLLGRLRRLTRQVRITSFTVTPEESIDDGDGSSQNQGQQVSVAIQMEIYSLVSSTSTATAPPPPSQ